MTTDKLEVKKVTSHLPRTTLTVKSTWTIHPVWQHGYPPSAIFAMYATRHMHEYDTTREKMALVSVKNHHNGMLNPYAQYGYEVTVDRVLNAPIVSEPLTLLDSCPVSDGSADAIICNIDLAKKYTDSPIYVAGFGFGTDYTEFHNKESFTSLLASVRASRAAYKMAGVGPKDIDVIELHDCFTITEIISYEDLGLCKKGEGGKLIQNGLGESMPSGQPWCTASSPLLYYNPSPLSIYLYTPYSLVKSTIAFRFSHFT